MLDCLDPLVQRSAVVARPNRDGLLRNRWPRIETGIDEMDGDTRLGYARCERLLPGEGNIDLHGLFAALPADLPVSMEMINLERERTIDAPQWAAQCLAASRPFLLPP